MKNRLILAAGTGHEAAVTGSGKHCTTFPWWLNTMILLWLVYDIYVFGLIFAVRVNAVGVFAVIHLHVFYLLA